MLQQPNRRPIIVKAADIAEDGTFSGYGSIFGDLDSYGDITTPGCFAASLAKRQADGTGIKLLWQHNPAEPIGVWTSIAEDDRGLLCKGKLILDIQRAREAYALMKGGVQMGLSIGFEEMLSEYHEPADVEEKFGYPAASFADGPNQQIRALTEVDLWEVSLVTFPALGSAQVDSVKRREPAARGARASALAATLSARNTAAFKLFV